jgi:hypothetical protein
MFMHWSSFAVQTVVVWLKGDEDWGYGNEVYNGEGVQDAPS